MKFSAVHNALIISPKELEAFANEIRYAMARTRILLKVPLTTRSRGECPLTDIDHLERSMIDACKSIGVDLGCEWGHQLDLTNFIN